AAREKGAAGQAGRQQRQEPDGSAHGAYWSMMLSAATWAGVVPQQPPMRLAPCASQPLASRAYSSGVTSWVMVQPSMSLVWPMLAYNPWMGTELPSALTA